MCTYIYYCVCIHIYIYIYPTSHGIPCCSRTVSAFGLKLHLRLRKARQTVAHPPLFGGGRFGALASNDLLRKHDMGMLYIWIYIYMDIDTWDPFTKNVGCGFVLKNTWDLYSNKRILQKKTWQDCWKFENL